MSKLVDSLVPDNIKELRPYQPGKPIEEVERELGLKGVIKIASNENPLGPSPSALEAAARAVRDVHLYPDGAAFKLRSALAEFLGVHPDRLVFGCGCNEILQMLVNTFCVPGVDEVVSHEHAFISYRLHALAHGCKFVAAPVTEELGCDVEALLAAVTDRTKIVFVANPNNPTGSHLTRAQLERLLEGIPQRCIVVLDEAYHEYALVADPEYPSSQSYATDRPALVTLRTFSKIYGLAGLRVGYGICSPEVADYLNRVRRPFNVNLVAQEAARAALADSQHVERSARLAVEGISALRRGAAALGLLAYPSLGNFVLVDAGRPSTQVYDAMLRQGVIVRPMAAWGLPNHLRISVGTEHEVLRAVEALAAALG